MDIKTVTVLGANGTMGRNIAAIFASFGNAKVYMVSRSVEKSTKAIEKSYQTVKAESIKANMIPVDYENLDECINFSDLIFEACAENWDVKVDIHQKIANELRKIDYNSNQEKLICSGTSGLSITSLAELYDEKHRDRFMGMHFFNPPYNLTLCELIPTKYNSKELVEEAHAYLDKVLYRTTVEVKDQPAFLGNRIGFQFINELLQLAEEYKYNGGIDYIDAIFGPFTGRNMAPLATANFVGLDVHKAIVDNLYDNTKDYAHETFVMPEYVVEMVKDGRLGRKVGIGLYKTLTYDGGIKVRQVYDIEQGTYREVIKYNFPFVEEIVSALKVGNYKKAIDIMVKNRSSEAELCCKMLLKYVIYALNTTRMVGFCEHSADDVMATGFGWCPPLAIVDALGGKDRFLELCKERVEKDVIENIDLNALVNIIEKSKYDYRRFLKAKR